MASFDIRRAANENPPDLSSLRLGFRAIQVLGFAYSYRQEHGHEPSYGAIMDALGFKGKEHVHRVVKRLESRGLVMCEGSGTTALTRGENWNRPVLRLI